MRRRVSSMDLPATTGDIEVYFYPNWPQSAPICPHGPMLLFERYHEGSTTNKNFYACAAYRDRKLCPAFVLEISYNKIKENKTYGRKNADSKFCYSLSDILATPVNKRVFCLQCQTFKLKEPLSCDKSHKLLKNISNESLEQPSKIFLVPKENDKALAQYFLSVQSTSFLLETLASTGASHVVCIGMPRLHELIYQKRCKIPKMQSILLDIDDRYKMFWDSNTFCKFNMFNHYFFDNVGLDSLKSFLSHCKVMKGKIAIVLDPPFGGLVDCIAKTLKWLNNYVKDLFHPGELPTVQWFWLFPYFMEKRIIQALPEMQMLDYCLNYKNHKKFQNSSVGRKRSPVRLFTNVPAELVKHPVDEGYRFCKICTRYVSENNKHCDQCNTCPSKDGRTYIHCKQCKKCVKPARRHCNECNRCELPNHICRSNDIIKKSCHICGKIGHRRNSCPHRISGNSTEDKNVSNLSSSECEHTSGCELKSNLKPRISNSKRKSNPTYFRWHSQPSHHKKFKFHG